VDGRFAHRSCGSRPGGVYLKSAAFVERRPARSACCAHESPSNVCRCCILSSFTTWRFKSPNRSRGQRTRTTHAHSHAMIDLLLVGAGPQNLCLLLRLLDSGAAAAVDVIRRPPSSKNAISQRAHRQRCSLEYRAAMQAWLEEHVVVIDERGQWMDRW